MPLRPSDLNKWLNPGKAVWSLKTLAGRCRDLLVLWLTKTSLVYLFMKTSIYQSGVACFFLRPLPALFVQGQFKIWPPNLFILWINISSLQSLLNCCSESDSSMMPAACIDIWSCHYACYMAVMKTIVYYTVAFWSGTLEEITVWSYHRGELNFFWAVGLFHLFCCNLYDYYIFPKRIELLIFSHKIFFSYLTLSKVQWWVLEFVSTNNLDNNS